MTERELIDLTAAEAAEEEEVEATAADGEQGGLATAETLTAVVGRAAATQRADAMPRDAMRLVGASGEGTRRGSCSVRGAAGRRGKALCFFFFFADRVLTRREVESLFYFFLSLRHSLYGGLETSLFLSLSLPLCAASRCQRGQR